jgi:hypothetical protein
MSFSIAEHARAGGFQVNFSDTSGDNFCNDHVAYWTKDPDNLIM